MNDKEREMFEPCKVRCISDDKSIFFKKGEIYDAFIPKCNGGKGFIAFYFSEQEMDEAGFYALPANRFEIISQNVNGDGSR
jgi:hypothetical protein